MEIIINILYISGDGTVHVIVIIAIKTIALFDFLLLLVQQLRFNPDPGSKVYAIAVVSNTQAKCVLVSPIGFYQ